MRESKIEKSVDEYAISRGWLPIKFTSPNMAGVPDKIYIGFGEKVLFVEFKQPKGKLSKGQLLIIGKFNLRSVPVYIIDDITMGKKLIDMNTAGL